MSRKSPFPALTLVEKKGSIYGRVRWRGEERWLGRASEQMHLEFARLRAYVAEHGRLPPREPDADKTSERLTVGDLCDLYEQHVAAYYRKDGEPTSEVGVQQLALGYLRARAAAMPAPAFGPLALADCREAMVANDVSRRVVNGFVNRIRACFRWAVAQQLVPPTVLEGLRALDPLKKGRSAARETTPITAVSAETVHQVTPHVSRQVAAMMLLQLHTGMRPQEVRLLRWSEIDRSETTWIYRPSRHKTEHHGVERVVAIGPRARAVLQEFRRTNLSGYVCSPQDAEAHRNRQRSEGRTTPRWPSHDPEQRRQRRGAARRVRDAYGSDTYGRAVKRGCQKAGVEPFTPNQLRHTGLTTVRAAGGLEASQAVGGHKHMRTTEIYAERNTALAIEVIERIG